MLRDQAIMFLATNVMFLVFTNAASLIKSAARKPHGRAAATRAVSSAIRPSDR